VSLEIKDTASIDYFPDTYLILSNSHTYLGKYLKGSASRHATTLLAVGSW